MGKKLEDVAQRAGVSKTTVSRVINRRGYLSQKTIAKVEQAIRELNYHPNTIARQLFTSKTGLIGILMPTVANPFFGELTHYLETKLFARGFKVLIGNAMNDAAKEQEYLRQLLGHQVDGLIVGTHNQGIPEYQDIQLPVVSVEREVSKSVPIIETDSYAGGRLATEALIKAGAQHIIHTDGLKTLETPDQYRRIGYEDVMKEHHLTPVVYTLDFNISQAEKIKIFARIFQEHPNVDGIFAANDTDAALIMRMAEQRGYQISSQLKLVGYDGTEIVRELLPDLATIVQPIEQMAQKAVEVLLKRINGEQVESVYRFPIKYHPGKTCNE